MALTSEEEEQQSRRVWQPHSSLSKLFFSCAFACMSSDMYSRRQVMRRLEQPDASKGFILVSGVMGHAGFAGLTPRCRH